MDKAYLQETAKLLVASGKGILAADESTGTIKKRFAAIGVESNPENNRHYRQLLFTTSEIEKYISGVIMFDETLRQKAQGKQFEGKSFVEILTERGVIPGIKVDKGTVDLENFPNEKITEGLDGFRERLIKYKNLGAKFSKGRAVFKIGEGIPSDVCIGLNIEHLSLFTALSQENDLVPIVEPEVLMDGGHSIEQCEKVTYQILKNLFKELIEHKVILPGMLLKPNMVISGKESSKKLTATEIAEATLRCFKEVVPKEVPGIVFLSGGQTPQEATENLNQLNKLDNVPWQLSFSFGRALQETVLKTWMGKDENIDIAQKEFLKRARLNSLARRGEYNSSLEEL